MKKVLIIGSCTVDITVPLPKLPASAGSVNSLPHKFSLGGCAFNVARVLHLLKVDHLHCTSIGSGMYGEFALKELNREGITPFRVSSAPHGACICLVEESGERSFIAYHGVEYTFDSSWLKDIDLSSFGSVYICGIEIEEESGDKIITFLENNRNLQIFFSPGPRVSFIPKDRVERILALNPIIHISESELFSLVDSNSLEDGVGKLFNKSNNDIIVTLGNKGALLYKDKEMIFKESYKTNVVDTTGAGDCHIGAYISYLTMGLSKEEALDRANYLASTVVSHEGPALVL